MGFQAFGLGFKSLDIRVTTGDRPLRNAKSMVER